MFIYIIDLLINSIFIYSIQYPVFAFAWFQYVVCVILRLYISLIQITHQCYHRINGVMHMLDMKLEASPDLLDELGPVLQITVGLGKVSDYVIHQ